MPRIALIGDQDAKITAHVAIPLALARARQATGAGLAWQWIGTAQVGNPAHTLAGFTGVWATPGSPYVSMDGALAAIRHARENNVPFLGTCGGFQHAVIEFARNVAGLPDADHAETNPAAVCAVVAPLECSLVEATGLISFLPGSRLHRIFSGRTVTEAYHCRYGVNPGHAVDLETAGLRFTGRDESGEMRAFELPGHAFFVGTLFQPERAALQGAGHPLVEASVSAAGG